MNVNMLKGFRRFKNNLYHRLYLTSFRFRKTNRDKNRCFKSRRHKNYMLIR